MTDESPIRSDQKSLALLVAENVSAMLAYWDKNLICRFANSAYRQWFGRTRDEMVDRMHIRELLGPELYQKNLPFIMGALEGRAQTFEREIPRPSGGTRHSLANYYPDIVNGEVLGFIVHVADISAVKELEAERLRVRDLEAKNKELEQFTYIASHDLQEPLRTISNYIEVIKSDHGQELNEHVRRFLDVIDRASARMSLLIRGLLDYSRLGRDRKMDSVDTKKTVMDVLKELESLIQETGARIHLGDLPTVKALGLELRQVFLNLIGNCIKFRRKDVPPELWIGSEKKGDLWEFSVRDNGIGIHPKHFGRIFTMFQRLHPREDYPGHGIGLAFCKKIVELHGGRIWVESDPGRGSTFCFTVPQSECEL